MAEMFINTLATALALAVIVSAEAAARKHDRDTCQSQQNDNCYYRGYPLWQRYSN